MNGTVVSISHAEHVVRVSVREIPAAAGPDPGAAIPPERRPLQGLHRFGSFLNCLSKKKSCSPAVKMNCPPQSAHVSMRSTNSMGLPPNKRETRARVKSRGIWKRMEWFRLTSERLSWRCNSMGREGRVTTGGELGTAPVRQRTRTALHRTEQG